MEGITHAWEAWVKCATIQKENEGLIPFPVLWELNGGATENADVSETEILPRRGKDHKMWHISWNQKTKNLKMNVQEKMLWLKNIP